MVGIACLLIYLAIVKKFEPLLLLPIAFGMLLTNLLGSEVYHEALFAGGHANWSLFGGAILVDSRDLVNLGQVTVNNAGAVLNAAGDVIGQITTSYSVGAQLTALGQLIAEDGVTILAESTSIIIKDSAAFISGGQVYSSVGTLLATAGQTITPGLLDYLYLGVKLGIYPCLIFIGVGAGTDFGPLIANPKTLLL
ncbi:MAG: sodium ion-translocating decarboxylase subunit beta, partial [Clostridia bacterium]|nr:sodium ion-translocating decarboxylase subunit beta [Clostridia bacterium]